MSTQINQKKEGSREGTIGNIGIDLGTTNTVVSYVNREGSIEHLKIGSKNVIPSAIFFDGISDGTNNVYFGDDALKRCRKNSQSIVRLFKRKIGSAKDDFKVVIDSVNVDILPSRCYVIDTNCFCNMPNVLDLFNQSDVVFLPITVTEELGYRKRQPETQYTAQEAIDNLASKDKYPCRIEFEESNLDLLPRDFFDANQNDKNDNKVLSVAIKHKDQNVLLITDDNRLRLKATQCGINSQKLGDFRLDKLPEKRKENNHFSISAEEATAYFLSFIRREVCKTLDCEVVNAVVTVPVSFNNVQVEATKRAAKNAGFQDVRIEKEPIAAAIAYSMDQNYDKNILIYDFGGGTFDVVIVKIRKEKNEFDVLAYDGDPKLGGQDITDEFASYIKEVLEDEDGLVLSTLEDSGLIESDFYSDLMIVEREAERVKQSLSSVEDETISLLNLFTPDGKGLNKEIPITKKEFEDIVSDVVRKPTDCIVRALNEAGLDAEKIDAVILSGGTSKMPIVKEKVHNYFGKLPFSDKDPATLIADGAAIIAHADFGPGDAPEIRPPVRKSKALSDIGVATGYGGPESEFDSIIPYGSNLPFTGKKDYYLQHDNQKSVDIKLYSRKKNSLATKCHQCEFLDAIHIKDIPGCAKKDVIVSVSYTLTEEYELKVSAEIIDKRNGNPIVGSNSLTIRRDSIKTGD